MSEETTTTTASGSSWKKTASVVAIAVGGLLIVLGNFFDGSLDLSATIVKGLDAVGAILAAFGVGGVSKSTTTTTTTS